MYRSLVKQVEFNEEVRYTHTPGDRRWFQIASMPHIDGDQVMTEGFVFDITKRKTFETELILTKEKAEESDRLKSAFLANISHEILTPLNGIGGLLNVLADDPQLSSGIRENIDDINRNSDRLISIISDVLDASQLETNQMVVHPFPVSISTLMDEMFGYLVHTLDAENKAHIRAVYVRNITDIDNDITIYVDPVRLSQILTRLLNNAVKFTDRGQIRMGWRPVDGGLAEFFVEDTGIGIAANRMNALFRPFRQLEDDYNRRYGGVGLGLSVSRSLARLMGGDMSVESVEGEGSRFVFTIKIVKSEE
jgi:signal transduction histidine kinase